MNTDERRLKAIGRRGLRRPDERSASSIFGLRDLSPDEDAEKENQDGCSNPSATFDYRTIPALTRTQANRIFFIPVVNASGFFICVDLRSSAVKNNFYRCAG
ncbi:MAG: hypothetical protein RQ729_01245 [Wenzhouxiangellaceae bacterium]|nr:hypothetical protein [Wenzhouxiangellaceae bacterium]